MNKSAILKATTSFAKEKLSNEATGHDFWHIERVLNNAKLINKKEKGDQFIIDMSLLLHDIGDRKVIGKKEDDYTIAENFLQKNNVDNGSTQKIMFIIKNMSFSNSFGKKGKIFSKEFKIVQDADRLDALGAIGIARAFAFGGSKGRPIFDPSKKTQKFSSTEEYKKSNSSTFHHFYEKILLLKKLINTKTGKEIAEKRHQYIKEYMKEFLLEWKGKR